MFNDMEFLIHGFPVAFVGPGVTLQVFFSVPVELHTVVSDLKHLAMKPCQLVKTLANNSLGLWPRACQTTDPSTHQPI